MSRYRQLDGLRGVAALIVVFNHYVQAVPEHTRLSQHFSDLKHLSAWESPWVLFRLTPLRLLIDGQAAVNVFFVLSGFVLALPVTRRSQPVFWLFLVKRVCRVYIPFAAVIVLVAIAWANTPMASGFAGSNWLHTLRPIRGTYSLSSHLLMAGGDRDTILDPPMWTLIHEMRVSLVFPLAFLLIRRAGATFTLVVSVGLSIMMSFGLIPTLNERDSWGLGGSAVL